MFSKITRTDELIRKDGRSKVISSPNVESGSDQEYGQQKQSCLGPTAHIKGDISLEEALRVEGKVEGKLTIRGKQLTIGKRALVKAEIHAASVVVHGTVEGDIHGEDLVHVHATAAISGSIYCKRIVVEDGARFSGAFKTSVEPTKPPTAKELAKASDAAATLKSVGS